MEANLSSNRRSLLLFFILIAGAFLYLSACSPNPTVVNSVSNVAPSCPECQELICPEPIRYEDLWASSPHADAQAEAFTHWDEDDPKEIPTTCAKCHSMPGFIDFLGIDGSPINQVDKPAITGTTVTCYVCHNEAIDDLDTATFPSGEIIRLLGPEARCIQCHQGRASSATVDNAIIALNLIEIPDVPSSELGFINSHSISAATSFGSEVQGAYQYSNKEYAGRYKRGEDFFDCLRCHNQHSLELEFETCGECHTIAGTEPKDIRVDTTDYDGDGDITEGISYEISSLHEALYNTIKAYAVQIIGIPIVYDLETHPYFFIDSNGNGILDAGENVEENIYNAWTPRLLRAAYNYNYVTHDPGAYAHNSDYVLQVIYDSLADLGGDVARFSRP